LSQLALSSLSDAKKDEVEAQFAAIEQLTGDCDIAVEADFENLADAVALEILSRISSVSQLCIDSESERVMRELDTASRKLPREAIKEVREHPDIFVPLLMRTLKQAIEEIRDRDEPGGDAAFFAVFLLTELEVTEAFPLLLDVFRLPDEGPFDLLGDGVHELVAPILALFSKGNTDKIGEVIRDSNVNMYVRWSAANAYKYLFRDELISRQVAVDALHQHFQDCIEADHVMLAPLACELGDLAAESSLEIIRTAFQRMLVDESVVNLTHIEDQIAAGEETIAGTLEYCGPSGMPDTITELSRWAAFRDEPRRSRRKPTPLPARVPRPYLLSDKASQAKTAPVVSGSQKVGRNALCPCGSGKKLKKCCR